MRQWDDGMDAAKLMVEWQSNFVQWWDVHVGVRLRPGGKDGGALNADRRSTLSKDKAEAETQITQQQVSRWRSGLKRPDYAARKPHRNRARPSRHWARPRLDRAQPGKAGKPAAVAVENFS